MRKAMERLGDSGIPSSQIHIHHDEDVLDTWFSSGLLPISATIDQIPHDDTTCRLSLMETGHDILFFWVARMVMLCSTIEDKNQIGLPFPVVLLHGTVRDVHGRKMSKSLGNVIDPLAVIHGRSREQLLHELAQYHQSGHISSLELTRGQQLVEKQFPHGIPECGSDALRMGLLSLAATSTHVVSFDLQHVIAMRHFCNKVWNSAKFVLTHLGSMQFPNLSNLPQTDSSSSTTLQSSPDWLMNRWILSRYATHLDTIRDLLETYRMGMVIDELGRFFIKEFCDIYLEACKFQFSPYFMNDKQVSETKLVLGHVWSLLLRELHPFAPYLTETVFTNFHSDHLQRSIMETKFPEHSEFANYRSPDDEQVATWILESIRSLRSFRQTHRISSQLTPLQMCISDPIIFHKILDFQSLISFLSRSTNLSIILSSSSSSHHQSTVTNDPFVVITPSCSTAS